MATVDEGRRRPPGRGTSRRDAANGHRAHAVVLLLTVFASLLGSPGTASGMNRGGMPICGPTVYYRFVDTQYHTWTAAEKDAVSAALDAWERVINRSGAPIVDLLRGSGTPRIDIMILDLGHPPSGRGGCNSTGTAGLILLDDGYVGQQARMNGVAVHEMGHVLGMAHVGWDDNRVAYTEDFSTMVDGRCVPPEESFPDVERALASLAPDDHAHLYGRQGAGGALSADPSFETAASVSTYFKVMNATFTRASSGSAFGTYHLRFTGNEPWVGGNHPYVSQETFIRGWPDWGPPGTLDAAAQVRKARAGDGGTVFVRLLRRPVSDPSECRFSTVPNQDWSIVAEALITPTTSWALYETPEYTGTTAAIFRVSVVNRLNYPCGADVCRAEIRVDDERVRPR